jgi:hypothetical protein
MFSIRDSVEPEDAFEDQDVFPCSAPAPPTHPNPITFDLPSTTSAATQPSSTSIHTQNPETPIATTKATKRRKFVDDRIVVKVNKDEDLWEFPIESPPSTSRRSTTMNERDTNDTRGNTRGIELDTVPSKSKKPNSTIAITERSGTRERRRGSSVEIEESPRIRTKRKSARQIEDSDTERIESPGPESQQLVEDIAIITKENVQAQVDDKVKIVPNSRKQIIAVEIPSKPKPTSKNKKPLTEIVLENLNTPDLSPVKSVPRQNTPEPTRPSQNPIVDYELKNVVLTNAPSAPPRRVFQEKAAVPVSPARPMNVASILAKSPNRPTYRVGLSRKVNVEPLHRYLKKNI